MHFLSINKDFVVRVFFPVVPFLIAVFSANFAKAAEIEDNVERLIVNLVESNCGFIRNGEIHSPEESMVHVRRKFNHFRDEISSVAEFIELSATNSLLSGKIYRVQCGNMKPLPAAEWMRQQASLMAIEL